SSFACGRFHRPCANDDPHGRLFVRAGFAHTCALRAPTLSLVRMYTIRTKDKVLDEAIVI
ncbi:MAG: hypothetical protein AAB133_00440, partial [Pseudomonadota bacterium]